MLKLLLLALDYILKHLVVYAIEKLVQLLENRKKTNEKTRGNDPRVFFCHTKYRHVKFTISYIVVYSPSFKIVENLQL